MHKHKCSSCGTIWQHSDSCGDDDLAHSCPRCGIQQWDKYYGARSVTYPQRCTLPVFSSRQVDLPGCKPDK